MRFLLMLFLLSSCGDETGYSNKNQGIPQEEQSTDIRRFSTRLTNNLLISGERCFGGEQTDVEGQTYTCTAGDYLVTVDNINSCTPEGCTEVKVVPVIGSLLTTGGDGGTTTFFDIVPSIVVSSQTASILETVQLRSRNGDNAVLFK